MTLGHHFKITAGRESICYKYRWRNDFPRKSSIGRNVDSRSPSPNGVANVYTEARGAFFWTAKARAAVILVLAMWKMSLRSVGKLMKT